MVWVHALMRTLRFGRCNGVMNATPPLTPPAARSLARPWWLAPALFTMAAVLGGAWGYRSSPIVHASAWLAMPYVVPLALVAVSWRSSARPDTRARGLVAGGIGAVAAMVCAHLTTFVLLLPVSYPLCGLGWRSRPGRCRRAPRGLWRGLVGLVVTGFGRVPGRTRCSARRAVGPGSGGWSGGCAGVLPRSRAGPVRASAASAGPAGSRGWSGDSRPCIARRSAR